jgi:hypothetical protein
MPVPVKVSLKNGAGKVVASATINAPGSHQFNGLPAGMYTVIYDAPDGYQIRGPSSFIMWREGGYNLTIGTPLKPSLGLITLGAIGMTLITPLFRYGEQPIVQTRPTDSRSGSTPTPTPAPDPPDILPPEVDAGLRACLMGNIQRLAGVPELVDLLVYLNNQQDSKAEFQLEVLRLYKTVDQLSSTIKECDPTLIQELTAAKEREADRLLTVRSLVNVRTEQRAVDQNIITQLPSGAKVKANIQALNALTQQQRLALEQDKGWYPVILLDGRRGYIDSFYLEKSR